MPTPRRAPRLQMAVAHRHATRRRSVPIPLRGCYSCPAGERVMAVALPENFRPLRRVEYDKLVELGVFKEERIELINGVLVPMSPIGTRHSNAIDLLTLLLVRALGDVARIRVQNPLAQGEISEPQP